MNFKFVICGLEHSGTTLVSDIFRQVDELDSGFECGVLLADSPKDFPGVHPFFKNMLEGWQISEDDLKNACDTDSFIDFYENLYQKSGHFKPSITGLFDKTPRYFQRIFECVQKVQVPFIATYKDPRSIVYSDFKRHSAGNSFESWYDQYKAPKLRYLSSIYKEFLDWKNKREHHENILCVSLENICLNTRSTVESIFHHVGLDFDVQYLLMKNLRYSHTRMPQVSSRIPFEFYENLNDEQIDTISSDFSTLNDWFYH